MIEWIKVPKILPAGCHIGGILKESEVRSDFISCLIFGQCPEGGSFLELTLGEKGEIILRCSSCGMIFAKYKNSFS